MNSRKVLEKYSKLPASNGSCKLYKDSLIECLETEKRTGYSPSHDLDCWSFRIQFITCLKSAGSLIIINET